MPAAIHIEGSSARDITIIEKQFILLPEKVVHQDKTDNRLDSRYETAEPRFPEMPFQFPRRNCNFEGREEALQELRLALTPEKAGAITSILAIHGLGGVGKTQLVLEYAYRNAADYNLICWFHAENTITLVTDYARLATTLNLPERNAPDQSLMINAVCNYLNQRSGWLLIFDNAEKPEDISDFLPQATSGHVLITSLNPNWSGLASPFELKGWLPEEAIAFLYQRTKQNDHVSAQELAKELGYLPLALEQAAAYIETAQKTLADYLSLFRQLRLKIFERDESEPMTDYRKTVTTTWELAFQQIQVRSSAAVELLNLSAFLASAEIPRSRIYIGIKKLSEHHESSWTKLFKRRSLLLANELEYDNAFSTLRSFSLITAQQETFAMHQLVQHVVRDHLTENEKRHWAKTALQIIAHIFSFRSDSKNDDIKFWMEKVNWLPHALATMMHARKLRVRSEDVMGLSFSMMLYLFTLARSVDVRPFIYRALEVEEIELGPEHLDVALSLSNFAEVLKAHEKYEEAEHLYRRALEIREKQLGSDHRDVAQSLYRLAELLRIQKKYVQAEPLYRRALAIQEKHGGLEHREVAQTLHGLAALLHNQEKFIDAEPLYRRALAIDEKAHGPSHSDVARDLTNLAFLLKDQGKYEDAEPLSRRALMIAEKQLGPEHLDIAQYLTNLATLLNARLKYVEAEPLYRRALAIREKQLGPDHPMVAQSLESLAGLLRNQRKYIEAEPLIRRALDILVKKLGPEHLDVAVILNNFAVLLLEQGKYTDAESLLRRALEIRKKTLGPEHPDVARSLITLALSLAVHDKAKNVKPLIRRALEIMEKKLDPKHPDVQEVRKLWHFYKRK